MDTPYERRWMVSFDIAGYGRETAAVQRWLIESLTSCVDMACAVAGVGHDRALSRADFGDSDCVVLPGDVCQGASIARLLDAFAHAVKDANTQLDVPGRLRTRVAAHHGSVQVHGSRLLGPGIVTLTRLRDCSQARAVIRDSTSAEVVTVLSGGTYEDLVRSGIAGWRPERFRRIQVTEKEFESDAWMTIPSLPADVAATEIDRVLSTATETSTGRPNALGAHGLAPQTVTMLDHTTIRTRNVYFGSIVNNHDD